MAYNPSAFRPTPRKLPQVWLEPGNPWKSFWPYGRSRDIEQFLGVGAPGRREPPGSRVISEEEDRAPRRPYTSRNNWDLWNTWLRGDAAADVGGQPSQQPGPFEQVLAGIESRQDVGPWGWASSRPPGHTIAATATSAGETVTPQGQVLLTRPIGYVPTYGQHDWSKVYRSVPANSPASTPGRTSYFNPETYTQDAWNEPGRSSLSPGALPGRYLTGEPGSRPTVSRRAASLARQQALMDAMPQAGNLPAPVPYPSLAGPYTPEFSRQARAAMDYAAAIQGARPAANPLIGVNTGIDTADQIWANSLMPLMANRAFNDVVVGSTELAKAFDQPGRSRDEGVYGMVGNAMQTLLAGAQQAALEDQMRRESENRLLQQQAFDLANNYGQALVGLMGDAYLQQLQNAIEPQLMGLQWLSSLLGS